jgi:hypothetical protein
MRDYVLARWHRRRLKGIELLGGACVDCGGIDTERLEFDHIDPAIKKFTISSKTSCSEKEFLEELAKCELRCDEPCHKERTRKQKSVEHGGGASGKRNCPCLPCKERKAQYSKDYKERRREK